MKRLLLWNLLLAICATAGIYELRREWMDTRAQEQVVLLRKPLAPKVEVAPVPPKPAPFQATNYTDVAQKTLFAKDRNPNVEIVAPPPPPPPPPMPALPRVYGVMGLPSGIVAIMTDKPGGAQKNIREGDTIGEFKVAKLDLQKITLTWMDKTVEKSIDELLDRTIVAANEPAPSRGAPAAAPSAAAPAPAPPPAAGDPRGIEIGDGIRACKDQTVETAPPGTVYEGFKKAKEATPFGEACRWLKN
jgi:hypothetical protein